MKKNYNMGRSAGKFIALALIALFTVCLTGSVVEYAKAKSTSGIESVMHDSNADAFAYVAVLSLLMPAIAVSGSSVLGFKGMVARKDGSIVTPLQNFLLDYLNMYGQGETQRAIQAGKIFFDPITYYIRFVITGKTGKQKILNETTQKQVGTTNFNLGYLPKFTNFAYNKIGVSYAVDATSASVAAYAVTGWTGVRSSVDKSLANGEIILSSARNVVLEHPIAPLLREAALTTAPIGASDYELEQPRLIKENELCEIEIDFGSNTVPSAANTTYAVEVRLSGVQVRLRG